MKNICISLIFILLIVFAFISCISPQEILLLDSNIIIKLTKYNGIFYIQGWTKKEYNSTGWEILIDSSLIGNNYEFVIRGILPPSGITGAGFSPATFDYSNTDLTNLTNDIYTIKFIYDISTDIYDLTVDAVKYEMNPMSGSFTYFENTSDMVLLK